MTTQAITFFMTFLVISYPFASLILLGILHDIEILSHTSGGLATGLVARLEHNIGWISLTSFCIVYIITWGAAQARTSEEEERDSPSIRVHPTVLNFPGWLFWLSSFVGISYAASPPVELVDAGSTFQRIILLGSSILQPITIPLLWGTKNVVSQVLTLLESDRRNLATTSQRGTQTLNAAGAVAGADVPLLEIARNTVDEDDDGGEGSHGGAGNEGGGHRTLPPKSGRGTNEFRSGVALTPLPPPYTDEPPRLSRSGSDSHASPSQPNAPALVHDRKEGAEWLV
ncbi:hypothetical protein T439DRAFT_363946 [Meredithblackwellia eburnea MCA 4105]